MGQFIADDSTPFKKPLISFLFCVFIFSFSDIFSLLGYMWNKGP